MGFNQHRLINVETVARHCYLGSYNSLYRPAGTNRSQRIHRIDLQKAKHDTISASHHMKNKHHARSAWVCPQTICLVSWVSSVISRLLLNYFDLFPCFRIVALSEQHCSPQSFNNWLQWRKTVIGQNLKVYFWWKLEKCLSATKVITRGIPKPQYVHVTLTWVQFIFTIIVKKRFSLPFATLILRFLL